MSTSVACVSVAPTVAPAEDAVAMDEGTSCEGPGVCDWVKRRSMLLRMASAKAKRALACSLMMRSSVRCSLVLSNLNASGLRIKSKSRH